MISLPQRDLLEHLEQGIYLKAAARLCGLSLSTIYIWLEIGKIEAEARASGIKANRQYEYHLKLWKAFDLGKQIQELQEAQAKDAEND